MSASHGISMSGLDVPHGPDFPAGQFGRMFPSLPPRTPTGLTLAEEYGLPGGRLDGGPTTPDQDNPLLAAGFTYLGQLIDHNVTFDATSMLGRSVDPLSLTDFRPPRLDLANVYGSGPAVHPYLYDPTSFGTKMAVSADGVDLARTSTGIALSADPRDDENLLLAQVHLAVEKFHNAIVDGLRRGKFTDAFGHLLPPKPPDEPPNEQPGVPLDQLLDVQNYYEGVFAAAQQLVRWHYQWIIVHEFLPLTCDRQVLQEIERNGPRFFHPGDRPFMPIEFAGAAFRVIGHPTVRSSYQVNERFAGKIFPDDPDAPTSPRTDLRGGPVDAAHAVDFSFFFATDPAREPQPAKKFDGTLTTQLLDLPVSAVPGAKAGALARPVASLAVRNLLRGETLGLPSGQDVARKIGQPPLTDEQLGFVGPTYLFYYLLKEAQLLGGETRLGPVGTRIVVETLIGLLDADPSSYRSAYPGWQPTLADDSDTFHFADLLRIAGVPGTAHPSTPSESAETDSQAVQPG
jgi:hypothetical protein